MPTGNDIPEGLSDHPTSLTRRGALLSGVGLAAAGGLAACSGGGGKSYSGSGNKGGNDNPGSGGGGASGAQIVSTPRNETLVVDQVNITVFDRFNPFIPNGEAYQSGLGQVVREYLFYANLATGKTQNWLGTSWSYSKDFKEMTLKLNPKAHWNDGQPFTSGDVKYSLELVKGNSTLVGGGPVTDEITSIATPDDHTVVISLNVADPRYHYNFICGIVSGFFIVPQHIWSKQDATKFANNPPVYTGPYKLQRAIADHQMVVWEKDPNYWNKAVMDPAPQYVVYRNSPSADAEFQQFKQAATDVTSTGALYQLVNSAIKGGYKNAIVAVMLDPCPDAVFVNADPSKGILADPRMRWAISCLIDRKKIGDSIWPMKTPPATYPWPAYANNKQWELPEVSAKYPLAYNPKKAAALLDQMGAKKGSDGKRSYQGKKLSYEILTAALSSDPEYFMVQLLASEMNKAGITTTMKAVSSTIYAERVQKGQYDIRQEWMCGEIFDPWQVYYLFQSKYTKPIGQSSTQPSPYGNSIRLKNPALDEDVAKLGVLSPDAPTAKPIYAKALDDWYQAMPAIMQIQKSFAHIFNTTYWKGWPTTDNLYQVPNNWWGQFMFIVGQVKPTGRK